MVFPQFSCDGAPPFRTLSHGEWRLSWSRLDGPALQLFTQELVLHGRTHLNRSEIQQSNVADRIEESPVVGVDQEPLL